MNSKTFIGGSIGKQGFVLPSGDASVYFVVGAAFSIITSPHPRKYA